MSLVPKDINEAIKHLTPRSEEELEKEWMERIEEINSLDSFGAISRVYAEVRDFQLGPNEQPISWKTIAAQILDQIPKEERKKAITSIMNDYFFG